MILDRLWDNSIIKKGVKRNEDIREYNSYDSAVCP